MADRERADIDNRLYVNSLFAAHFDCTFATFSGCHSHLMRELLWCLANWSQFRPADRHIVVYVLSKTYKSLEINSAWLYELQKRWGFPLLWCSLQVLTIHSSLPQRRAWSYGYGVCIGLCIKPAVNSWALEGRSTWELLCLGFRAHAQ